MGKRKPKLKTGQGRARDAFFASDKPLSMWRGRPAVMKDRKKETNRNACRGKDGLDR